MIERIMIDRVGGGDDRNMLEGCYFLPTNRKGKYDFYQKGTEPPFDAPLARDVAQSSTFHFDLGLFHWTVNGRNFLISETAAHGEWHNNDDRIDPDDGNGESGTFTAQAGGGTPVETAASAKA